MIHQPELRPTSRPLPGDRVYFCVFRMSAPGAYHVPLIVVEQYGGLYEVLQGGAHLFEREVRL